MAGVRTLLVCVVVSSIVSGVGLAGAWAFNAESGAIAHSEAAWNVFGIAMYLGFFASVVFLIALLPVAVVAALRGELRTTDRHAP